MTDVAISRHAVERYVERVEPLTCVAAADAIRDLLRDARLRPTPRHWMREQTTYGSGVRFAYSPRASQISLVLRGTVVVTVVTRDLHHSSRLRARADRRHDRGLDRRRSRGDRGSDRSHGVTRRRRRRTRR
jgi:hypothetical protein